ncbi:gfo/Idh/MocA family oxidoreductase [Nakamurella sp. YIM 132087]|uniref:Gfo/Idh/MocA family oxidoreductase n=1 Tax=Nakamurella alba TaxID=2665158 RepID=A0A7K1FF72_9ACTN|nr:gfo/Idh/MocA family oxidoreductase [Nakamurella alba]
MLGTGGIGRVVVPAVRNDPVTEIVAVAGRSAQKAAAYSLQLGIPVHAADFRQLLARDDIDAVYVALPPSLHAEWTIEALRAGKHVVCEKPFSLDPDAVAECHREADRAGRLLFEAFMWRYHPQTVLARRIIGSGAIGEVATVRAALTITTPPDDIRRDPALDGGAVGDVGAYCISAVRLFGGPVSSISAVAVGESRADGSAGVDDLRVAAAARCASGVLGVLDIGLDLIRRDELEIIGTAGKVVIPDPWLGSTGVVEVHRWNGAVAEVERVPVDPHGVHGLTGSLFDGYRIEFATIADIIAGDHPQEFGADDAVDQARTLAALLTAVRTGTPTPIHHP